MGRSLLFEESWKRWLFTAMAFGVGTGLNFLLQPALEGRAPLLPYFPALVLTGLCAGAIPAGALLVAAALTVMTFWMEPIGALDVVHPQDFILIVLFLVSGGMVAGVSAWARSLVLQARRTRRRLNMALEAGRMATWDWEVDSGKLVFSGGAEPVFGSAPLAMNAAWPLVHPDDVERARAQVEAAIKENRDFDVLSRIKAKDGDYRWLHSFGHVHAVGRGNALRVSGVTVDVSERQSALEASRAAEARLHLALQAGKVTAWECDDQRRYTWVYNLQLGLKPEDLLGRRIGETVRNKVYLRAVERVYATGEQTEFELDVAYQGQTLHYLCYLRGEKDDNGKLARVVGASVDVTELEAARGQIELESQRKDTFLATLAHELRNPLAPIRYAASLIGEGATPAQRQQGRTVIHRQAAQMARLLDDLLDMSRITRNAIELQRQVFDLRTAAEQAAEAAQQAYKEMKHRLVLALPAGPVMVDGDPARLQQVLGNLLDNAAKYTPPGGEVTLRLDAVEGQAVVLVRDNGIGIDPARQREVFDMFVQLHEPGRGKGGLGIGLAVVRQLVELHGGAVSARSEGEGKGAEFEVAIPLSQQPAPKVQSAGPEVVGPCGQCDKVLVVDDNRDTADTLSMLLGAEGFFVSTAYDGRSALQAFDAVGPAVVLLDIGLPDVSGYDVARQMRQLGAAVILVAVTGWGQEKDRAASAAAGFDLHLVKPVDPQQLSATLRDILRPAPR